MAPNFSCPSLSLLSSLFSLFSLSLSATMPKCKALIGPSILACDLSNLAAECKRAVDEWGAGQSIWPHEKQRGKDEREKTEEKRERERER
jgi:hypothetical protein